MLVLADILILPVAVPHVYIFDATRLR